MLLIKYKILLIDHKIKGIDIIKKTIKSNVKIILIDKNKDTYVSLLSKIEQLKLKEIDCIGIIKDEEYNDAYNLFNNSYENHILKNIYKIDPKLETWYEFINILSDLKLIYKLKEVDFISCNLASNSDYNYVFNKLEEIVNIKINGSTKISKHLRK